MIAILPTIQAQEKSYHGFLFYENAKNGVMIWKRILNLKNKYHFPLTLNDIPAKKKAIVAVRTEIMNSGSNGGIYTKPLHYLSDSSLSQDLGKHEIFFTNTKSFAHINFRCLEMGKILIKTLLVKLVEIFFNFEFFGIKLTSLEKFKYSNFHHNIYII